LIPVYFSMLDLKDKSDLAKDPDRTFDVHYYCPCCRKACHNAMKLTFSRHCGHVICADCIQLDSLGAENKQGCLVCSEPFGQKDLVFLQGSEGTGYAGAGGKVTAKKDALAFI
jgi:Rtf2 RING-finger